MGKQQTNPIEKLSYGEAVAEIESILEKIENAVLDVDELAEQVSRVTLLLKMCRDRLHKTEAQIEEILNPDRKKK